MKSIKLIYTGGTIGGDVRGPSADKLVDSDLNAKVFRDYVEGTIIRRLKEPINLLPVATPVKKFSEEMAPNDWSQIARAVYEAITTENPDGVVIAHGTDTLPYTTSALSYMLAGVRCPVIVTGSNLPLSHPNTDAIQNLTDAILVAVDNRLKGVFAVFSGITNMPSTIHVGTRVRKVAFEGNGFKSINVDEIGVVRGGILGGSSIRITNGILLNDVTKLNESQSFQLVEGLKSNIAFFQIYPGFRKEWIESAILLNVGGIILEVYNSGTACTEGPFSLVPQIEAATDKMIPVFFTSQQEGTVEMDVYRSSVRLMHAGAISLRDMIREAAIPKLMWVRNQFPERNQIKDVIGMMQKNLVGEIAGKG